MSLKLRLMNDSVLRQPTQLVTNEDLPFILSQIDEMVRIMKREQGLGLAANQVGISKRFFIMPLNDEVKLFINPTILELDKISPYEEGCLSIPGTSAQTMRAKRVKLSYLDENMMSREIELEGVLAVAVQHEVDHLDGKLYIDQLQPMRRLLTVEKHRKFLKLSSRRN